MKSADDTRREDPVTRDRISTLSTAILRISASLDVDTVLREVVESGRSLTGAGYGAITTVDDAGQPQDFVTSGFTPEEHRQLAEWRDGPRLFEHFRELAGPLRVRNLPAYVRALGFSSDLMPTTTFQGTPLRHRGVHVGHFCLANKEGGREFTSEDEEILVLFASQAATAIVNARTHRDERRARADLEALIDTSPVGVVVFEASTGRPLSVNREARRIVDDLRKPDQPAEQLLNAMTCRRGDGREIALDELPLAEQLSNSETVRAEEVVLSVPGGRSVTTLINATPIRSADGIVESVVVTIQDLAPLEELERQRTEFLGMVSHELLAPLTSIKGSAATALGGPTAPRTAETQQLFRLIEQQADHMSSLIRDLLDAGRIETGTLSVEPEPSEVAGLVDHARNTFVSGGGRHALTIDLPPDLPRVMADRQRIVQVLSNLLSNAARHSPEASPIRVAATREGVHVAVSVSDQGRGVPPDQLPHLFQKHSGAAGGRRERGAGRYGLGLAICRGVVEAHGGRIRVESAGPGRGTRFTFTIPAADEAGAAAPASIPSGSRREGRSENRILVVDDDPQTLRYVRDTLAAAGYTPLATGDPGELSGLLKTKKPQLVLLDLLLPETDGIELMERIPELGDLPVIFISAYGRDETIVRALDAGAADYIVKPFSPTELAARVRAALRKVAKPAPFALGELAIHYEQRRVTVADRPVQLTVIEYELLRVLSVNAGRVLTYDALLRQAWGGQDTRAGASKLVHAFVKKLRRKLGEDAASPTYILNQRGVGYRMAGPDGS